MAAGGGVDERDERQRESGPTWKLISNEPRVKSKLIRFRLAGTALTNLQVFRERETFRRASAIIRRTGVEQDSNGDLRTARVHSRWHSLHDKH